MKPRTAWGIGELAESLYPRHPDEPDLGYSFLIDQDYVLMCYLKDLGDDE